MPNYFLVLDPFAADGPGELSVEQGGVVVSMAAPGQGSAAGWILIETAGQRQLHIDGDVRVRGSTIPHTNGAYRLRRDEPHDDRPVWERAGDAARTIWYNVSQGQWVLGPSPGGEVLAKAKSDEFSPVGLPFDQGVIVAAEGFVPEAYLAEITRAEAEARGAILPAEGDNMTSPVVVGSTGDTGDASRGFGAAADTGGFGMPPSEFTAPPGGGDAFGQGFGGFGDVPQFSAPPADFGGGGFPAPTGGGDATSGAFPPADAGFGGGFPPADKPSGGFGDFPPAEGGFSGFPAADAGKGGFSDWPSGGFDNKGDGFESFAPPPGAAQAFYDVAKFSNSPEDKGEEPKGDTFRPPPLSTDVCSRALDTGIGVTPQAAPERSAGRQSVSPCSWGAAGRAAGGQEKKQWPPPIAESSGPGGRSSSMRESDPGRAGSVSLSALPAVESFLSQENYFREKKLHLAEKVRKASANVNGSRAMLEACRETNMDHLRSLRELEVNVQNFRDQIQSSVDTLNELLHPSRSDTGPNPPEPPGFQGVPRPASFRSGGAPLRSGTGGAPLQSAQQQQQQQPLGGGTGDDPFGGWEDPFKAVQKMGGKGPIPTPDAPQPPPVQGGFPFEASPIEPQALPPSGESPAAAHQQEELDLGDFTV
eukprot:Hpha_TRINITY_DN7868_c0_g1::TRINITY_DN7868_c0_g1_i2::g.185515::m.185515